MPDVGARHTGHVRRDCTYVTRPEEANPRRQEADERLRGAGPWGATAQGRRCLPGVSKCPLGMDYKSLKRML